MQKDGIEKQLIHGTGDGKGQTDKNLHPEYWQLIEMLCNTITVTTLQIVPSEYRKREIEGVRAVDNALRYSECGQSRTWAPFSVTRVLQRTYGCGKF